MKHGFTNIDDVRAMWNDCQTQEEKDKFERSYRRYLQVFNIKRTVIDPDEVFYRKDAADAERSAHAAEAAARIEREQYDNNGGPSESVWPAESDTQRPEPTPVGDETPAVYRLLDQLRRIV